MGKHIYHITCTVYGKNTTTNYMIKRRVHTKREGEEILAAFNGVLRSTDPNGVFYYMFEKTTFDGRADLMLRMNEVLSVVTMVTSSNDSKSTKLKPGFQAGGTDARSSIIVGNTVALNT